MHGLVLELALQVYKTICNIYLNLEIYYIVREKLSNIFFHIVSSQTTSYIAQMQYM